jgi:hypothetical protein
MCIAVAIRRMNVEQDCSPRFQGDAATAILATAAGLPKRNPTILGKYLTLNDSIVPGVNLAYHFSIL